MKHTVSVLDILQIEDIVLKEKESTIACYTGIITENIPKESSFKYFYDKSDPKILVEGDFTIKYIEILSKPSEELVSGYNAVIFIKSNVPLETIKSSVKLDDNGNIVNVYELSNINPSV